METSPHLQARRQAFRLLSLRARSEKEIRDRLAQKHGPRIAEEVIRQFRTEGFVDDNAFARERARQLAVNHLAGNRAIETDLLQKGIERSIAAAAIATAREELSEADAVKILIEKKRPRQMSLPDRKWKERTARFLMARGFPTGLIYEGLNDRLFHTDC